MLKPVTKTDVVQTTTTTTIVTAYDPNAPAAGGKIQTSAASAPSFVPTGAVSPATPTGTPITTTITPASVAVTPTPAVVPAPQNLGVLVCIEGNELLVSSQDCERMPMIADNATVSLYPTPTAPFILEGLYGTVEDKNGRAKFGGAVVRLGGNADSIGHIVILAGQEFRKRKDGKPKSGGRKTTRVPEKYTPALGARFLVSASQAYEDNGSSSSCSVETIFTICAKPL